MSLFKRPKWINSCTDFDMYLLSSFINSANSGLRSSGIFSKSYFGLSKYFNSNTN